jgi:hypothetical protein
MIADDAMTEDGWRNARGCDGAAWMIRCLWRDTAHPSARRSQLFACACARRVWHFLVDERSRLGVEAAERYLDGDAPREEAEVAAEAASDVCQVAERGLPHYWPSVVAAVAARPCENRFNDWKAPSAMRLLGISGREVPALVRDVFNPFRRVRLDRGVLGWQDGTVPRIAEAVYHERRLPSGTFDPGVLAVLADALEDAGCTDESILSHLRSSGPHVRGCWAVDLILGKE